MEEKQAGSEKEAGIRKKAAQTEEIETMAEKVFGGKAPKDNSQKDDVLPKRHRAAIFLVVIGVLAVCISLMFVIPFYIQAAEIGRKVGEDGGKIAGVAVGSFQGITKEIPEGWEDGKQQGLSAEDTEVDVIERIEEIGRLEVLAASVRLDDYLKIADDYSAIYVYKADAIFSVDLKNAEIHREGDNVMIVLGNPAVDFYINEEDTEKIAEWQRRFYSGKTADGYTAYINSRAEIEKKAPEEIKNYDTLMDLAKDSAKNQLGILVRSVCGEGFAVEILFKEGE